MLTLGAVSAPHLQCRWPGHPRVTSARGWGETGQRSLGKEQGPQVCPAPPPPVSPPSAQPAPWPTSPLGSVLVVTHQGPQASAPTQAAAPSHCDQVCPGKPSHRLGPAARWPELGRQVGTLGRRVLGGQMAPVTLRPAPSIRPSAEFLALLPRHPTWALVPSMFRQHPPGIEPGLWQ